MSAWRKPSLSVLMSIVIFMTTAIVFGIYTAVEIYREQASQAKIIKSNVTETVLRLSTTMAPFIASYSINEYEKLIASEVDQDNHQHLAIIIHDFNMGEIIGSEAYVYGVLQKAGNGYENYKPDDDTHQEIIAKKDFFESREILSVQGKVIGRVDVYGDDRYLRETLNKLFITNLMAALTVYLIFSLSLLYLTKRFFINPLQSIIAYLTDNKYDTLPSVLPDLSSREIIAFSKEINALVNDLHRQKITVEVERARLQNVIDGTNAGTWEWNVETGETIFNERWAEIIGHTLEELSPVSIDTWKHFVHPDDFKISEKKLQQVFSKQVEFYECEVRMKHKGGRWIWVLDRGRVIQWSDEGHPVYMYGIHVDISALKMYEKGLEKEVRKRTEELIIARDKAEAANRSKSQFLANMSHELRTPMHSITSFTQLALNKIDDKEKVERFLNNINESGSRLTKLLNDLLDLSKLEAGKMALNLTEQDVNVLFEKAIHEIDSLLKQKNLTIEFNKKQKMECMIDRDLIFQVFINLLSNAIKFSPVDGIITIEVNQVDEKKKGFIQPFIQISVIDEGVGIPEAEIDSVFESFVQSSKTSSKKGGTGLGLPISKEIIQLHGGEIWAQSPPLKHSAGTALIVLIPLRQQGRETSFFVGLQDAIESHSVLVRVIDKMMFDQQLPSDKYRATISNEHLCILDQWIDNVLSEHEEVEEIRKLHRHFHLHANDCVFNFEKGNYSVAMNHHKLVHEVSNQLVKSLLSMNIIVWSDKYSVGIKAIDEQHQKLVSLINEISSQLLVVSDIGKVQSSIKELIGYVEQHIEFEERMLADAGYTELASHQQKHRDYLNKFYKLAEVNENFSKYELSQLSVYLLDWWDRHILEEDMKYKPLFQAKK